MSTNRLLTYLVLALWLGAASYAWTAALFEGRTLALVTTSVISVGLIATLALMGRHDERLGRVES